MKQKLMIFLVSALLLFTVGACDSPTAPDPVEETPEVEQKIVTRAWFYKKVHELEFIGERILIKRADWLAELLEEVDIAVAERKDW